MYAFWAILGSQNWVCSTNVPYPKISVQARFQVESSSKWASGGSKMAHSWDQGSQALMDKHSGFGPNPGQKGVKKGSKMAQNRPKTGQNGPFWGQNGSKVAKMACFLGVLEGVLGPPARRLKMAQNGSKWPFLTLWLEGPGSRPGTHLEWPILAILGPF